MSCIVVPEFVKHMKRDPSGRGFTHLGRDGVLRTISGDYEVVDARGLTPDQIQFFLDVMPIEGDRGAFRGVDGTTVTSHEGLFHPAPGIVPQKPDADEEMERRRVIEQSQTAYREVAER
ncbi:hypothetical protein BDV28DRAFT_144760 [Aspergillus coremiiformis]|uniref:Uncharacterized protein n=1 Tax=Aspergillus coremiiformis TaxID=138285 RepID=A0A5N6ZIS2_9EURO|nr:hypothetical protein BDV28DRAFT_144760 [Aspergillus coremiiformis]